MVFIVLNTTFCIDKNQEKKECTFILSVLSVMTEIGNVNVLTESQFTPLWTCYFPITMIPTKKSRLLSNDVQYAVKGKLPSELITQSLVLL